MVHRGAAHGRCRFWICRICIKLASTRGRGVARHDTKRVNVERNRQHRTRLATLAVATLLLCSCEAWKERMAYWNSPQGQALQAQQMMQLQQQSHQQSMAADQMQFQLLQQQAQMSHDHMMRMKPVKVEHSGSVDVRHSGSLHVRRW